MRFDILAASTFDRCQRTFDLKSGALRVDLSDDSCLVVDHFGRGKVQVTGDIHIEVRTAMSTYLKPDTRGARGDVTIESEDATCKIDVQVNYGHVRNDIVIAGPTT